MTEILQQERLLKEVRDYFEPKAKPVPEMTKSDIEATKLRRNYPSNKVYSVEKVPSTTRNRAHRRQRRIQKACEIERMLLSTKRRLSL